MIKENGKAIYILGIYDGHLSTATLLKDGKIVASASEERFKRKKNYSGFPYESIKYVLGHEGIKGKDLSMVVIPQKWGVPVFSDPKVQKSDSILNLSVAIYKPLLFVRRIWGYLEYRLPFLSVIRRPLYETAFKVIGGRTIQKHREFIAKYLKIKSEKIRSFEHHLSHAAAAYYTGPYNGKDALVLTIDGEGDLVSSSVNVVESGKWKRLAETSSDTSLGWLYMEVTGCLGMKRNEHEYKVMGLAPYAKDYGVDAVYEKVKDIITIDKKNPLKFKSNFDTHLSKIFIKKEIEEERFDNIAGAFQGLVEERLTEWVKNAVKKTKISTVCLSGGVAMNVKANQKIAELKEVNEFYVCPSSGDESTPTGACYLGYLEFCKENDMKPKIEPFGPLYFGPAFSNTEIKRFLTKGGYFKKYKVRYIKNIEKTIARMVAEDKIVARMNGRMEWGARALGNRSILSNPSNPDLVKTLNEQVKGRDFWMPFTPSILKERGKDYLVNPKGIPAPYMILTFDSTNKAKKDLKAAMHSYDETIRPQLVEESWNPSYFKILKEFETLTGIGGVLNTSFNLHGLPIVLGPEEAMYVFEKSGLEYLAMENYLISKN